MNLKNELLFPELIDIEMDPNFFKGVFNLLIELSKLFILVVFIEFFSFIFEFFHIALFE